MCQTPIKILNPKKWIAPDSGQPLYLRVPCGHCIECRKQKQNEWRIRSYSECVDTLENGGYMLFDTLTYKNEYLPRVSDFVPVPKELDFSCFRSLDVQLFIKRLRTYLSRPLKDKKTKEILKPAYDVNDNLRFFLVCEYGKEQYTSRPHYHVFFFVKNNAIPPLVLSAAISHCWHFGRTDGLPFRTSSYVLNHNVFRDLSICTKRCILYISKYVAKDFLYSDMVKKRLYRLMLHEFPDYQNPFQSKRVRNYYNLLSRFVSPFHRQSENFGYQFLKYQSLDSIIENGFLKFNFNGFPQIYSLFAGFKRKFFYNIRKTENGIEFYLNAKGIQYKINNFRKNLVNLEKSVCDYNLCHVEKLNLDCFSILYNQDRLLGSLCTNFSDCKKYLLSSLSIGPFNGLRNYCSIDRCFINKSIFTKTDFGSKKNGFLTCNILKEVYNPFEIDSNEFISLENLSRYVYFDSENEYQYQKLLDWLSEKNKNDMAVARHKERLIKNLKSYNLC